MAKNSDLLSGSNVVRTSRRRADPTRLGLVAIVSVVVMASIGWVLVNPGGSDSPGLGEIGCADRTVVVDLSSSVRSERWRNTVVELVASAGASAAVCDQSVSAVAVVGGGLVLPLLTTGDIDVPLGPNDRVRRSRFTAEDHAAVRAIVVANLDSLLSEPMAVDTTSIAALYHAAAEHSGPDTGVLLITDGVNQDEVADLNRPLIEGDGSALASLLTVPSIGNRQTTIVGLGQLDAVGAAPGVTWSVEVRSFNIALCKQTKAGECRPFAVAEAEEALASPPERTVSE